MVALETSGLGKRYGRKWGLEDCSFRLPAGGSRRSLDRTAPGSRRSFGWPQGSHVRPQARSGYSATHHRSRPSRCSVRSATSTRNVPSTARSGSTRCCASGSKLNPTWDDAAARGYLAELDIPPDSKVGNLSVGQQAQVALTMCLAKRPALLLLDEPVAALDPVAREGLMHVLLRSVVDDNSDGPALFPRHFGPRDDL